MHRYDAATHKFHNHIPYSISIFHKHARTQTHKPGEHTCHTLHSETATHQQHTVKAGTPPSELNEHTIDLERIYIEILNIIIFYIGYWFNATLFIAFFLPCVFVEVRVRHLCTCIQFRWQGQHPRDEGVSGELPIVFGMYDDDFAIITFISAGGFIHLKLFVGDGESYGHYGVCPLGCPRLFQVFSRNVESVVQAPLRIHERTIATRSIVSSAFL